MIGKGTVQVFLGRSVTTPAYHTPEFNCNVLALHVLSEHFNILITSSRNMEKCCIMFNKTDSKIMTPQYTVKCENGLYPLHSVINQSAAFATINSNYSDYELWHRNVGHISSDRYQHLSQQCDNVKPFPRHTTENLFCRPRHVEKMKKATIKAVTSLNSYNVEIYFETSGPITPTSLGVNSYGLHVMESF